MNLLRSLRNPSFALLWSGQTISRLGDRFYSVALALWILEKTHSATIMGIVLVCSDIPTLLLLLLGGVFVDRFSRLRILLLSDVLCAVIVGLIAVLDISGQLQLWHILVMSACFGAADAFFYPAYSSVIPDIVEASDLPSANSLRSISLQLAGIIGPASAGFVVARGGSGLAFAFDSLSFVVSALCLVLLPRRKVLLKNLSGESSILGDLREGIQTVLQSPWLWITIVIASISTVTLDGPFGSALPLLVEQRYGIAAQTYGTLMALSSVGSLLAAIWLGRRKRLRYRGYLVYGAWMLASLMLTFIGLPLSLVVMGLVICLWGIGVTLLGLTWTNSLQEFVPPHQLGRVNSIDALVSNGLVPIGYAFAGIAADHFGASSVFVWCGMFSTLVIGLGLLHPAIRSVD